jgi:uncharacterized protein
VTATTTPARIGKADRIANLDVLRGIAILFILLMNIPYMGAFGDTDYYPQAISWTRFDRAAWGLQLMLDGTQRGLLELLFGAGVLIMARTAMTPDGPVAVADLHMRRNLWLMAFGVFHGVVLLWSGDILLAYGTAALLVFPFRTLSVRWLLIIGIAINALLLVPDVGSLMARRALVADVVAAQTRIAGGAAASRDDTAVLAEWQALQAEVRAPAPEDVAAAAAYMLGPLPDYVAGMQSLWAIVEFSEPGIYYASVIEALGMMLIGMALFKTGVIQGRAAPRVYWILLLVGYGIGLAWRVPAAVADMRFDALPHIGWVLAPAARLPMTLGHLGAVTLLLGTGVGARLLAPFQAAGQMPLTLYFSASLMAILVFGGPFLGLWNTMGYGALFTLALAVIAGQLVFANLWLRPFVTGPAEWVWKSLSYIERQPFVRR